MTRTVKRPKRAKTTGSAKMKAYLDAGKRDTRLLGPVERHLLAQPPDDRRTDVLHPSEMAKSDWCHLASYYLLSGMKPPAEVIRLQRENVFAEGHLIHHKWQGWLADMGVLVGNWWCAGCTRQVAEMTVRPTFCGWCGKTSCVQYREVPLRSPEHRIAGHSDGWVTGLGDEALIEIKGLVLDTPLPTPSGWTTMRDVRVGDSLLGSDGAPTRVVAKSPVRYVPTYRVTFDDRTEVVCDRDHLWSVASGSYRSLNNQVLTTEEIARTLRLYGQRQHRVVNAAPLQLPDADLPVDPYLLGAWIGDGSTKNGSAFLTKGTDLFDVLTNFGVTLGSPRQQGRVETRSVHGLITGLRSLGLAGLKSPDRYVPDPYLRGSIKQRLALLRGLMDTDGTWMNGRNQASFTTTSARLARDVAELVASLGERPYSCSNLAHGFGLEVVAYHVRWTPHINPFHLRRKRDLAEQVTERQRRTSSTRIIYSVEPGPAVPTQCVQVDSRDSTYLCTRSMVPTHNSVGTGTIRFEQPSLLTAHNNDLEEVWKNIRRPFPSHYRQGQIYLALAEIVYGSNAPKEIVFLYEFKLNQSVKEFVVEYDSDSVEHLLEAALDIVYAVEKKRPPRCNNDPADGCAQCRPLVAALIAAVA